MYSITSFVDGLRKVQSPLWQAEAARSVRSVPSADDPGLYSGLIRLHILHRAAARPIFGQAMIHELARHGYRLSAGTRYPMLHEMERQRYLRSRSILRGRRSRRVYRTTVAGRKALAIARQRVEELFGETFDRQ
jgi:PadR family transcriptional regulator PadR